MDYSRLQILGIGGWLALILGGMFCDAALLLRLRRPLRGADRRFRAIAQRPVKGRDLVLVTVLFVGATTLSSVLTAGRGMGWQIVVNTVSFHWMVLLFMPAYYRLRRTRWETLFGPTAGSAYAAGLLAYLAAVPVILIHSAAVRALLRLVGITPTVQPVVELLSKHPPAPTFVYLILVGCVIAPVAEEIYFRGLLLPLLMRGITPFGGIIACSLIFAAVHMHLTSAPALFVVALACSAVYISTGSLMAAIVTHAVFNMVNILLALLLAQ
ncbi:MAG TPA: CPBP family intramembrane metalloprotease [Kiritimatiellae bacterium]|nr:CPBP family intramembrane metalloprotease [Kiritimatiellia bacterium]